MSYWKCLVPAAMLCIFSPLALAQQQFIYPSRGQSQAQQERDKYECSQWATQQTDFDPTVPAPIPQASAPPPPGMFGGAFRGAAFGAIGGAIGGNAGKGAAIGAGIGALFGAVRRNRYAQEQEYNADQETSTYLTQKSYYLKAMDACLTGRGYTVD